MNKRGYGGMAVYDYNPRYGMENYSIVFPLEDTFDSYQSTMWMQKNWQHSITASVLYVVLIYTGQKVDLSIP